jgi:fructose-specific phosphotransferase system IIA component
MTRIFNLLNERNVFASLAAKNKEEVLRTLISSLEPDVEKTELIAIEEAVFEREKIMSTGVGKGLAIPHGKLAGINNNYAAFAMLQPPVDYQSVDEEPVSMVFLLVGPKSSNSMHIKMLSHISRLMNNNSFRQKLKECTTSKEILNVFEEEEHLHFTS